MFYWYSVFDVLFAVSCVYMCYCSLPPHDCNWILCGDHRSYVHWKCLLNTFSGRKSKGHSCPDGLHDSRLRRSTGPSPEPSGNYESCDKGPSFKDTRISFKYETRRPRQKHLSEMMELLLVLSADFFSYYKNVFQSSSRENKRQWESANRIIIRNEKDRKWREKPLDTERFVLRRRRFGERDRK